ncbi:MAG TPA: hypothetical protein VIL44_00070 [Micromonospora sp.]
MTARRYEFRVEGRLTAEERAAFLGMRITEVEPETVIDGEVIDESHLHGIVAQLHSLGITLVSAHPVPE